MSEKPKIETAFAQNVLEQIIERGGLIAECAKQFTGKYNETREFLADCAEQCMYTNIHEFWGIELTEQILKFHDASRNNDDFYDVQNLLPK